MLNGAPSPSGALISYLIMNRQLISWLYRTARLKSRQLSVVVEDFLFEEGIVRMVWPVCSPDMNPVEHVGDALGRRVACRQPPPQTLQELKRALLEEWDRIHLLVINSLIDSMPQRCSMLLAGNGNHTPY
ncbi:transposable element Tcb2 transposase [Trichonephila clavipes]|nr:transposable element Tcb2 transposase [Trichonephila clavipes]